MLLLVDYSSLLYRAFFAMPDTVPMHGVHGFLGMLARLVADRRPTRVGIAVDDDWRPAFRVEALPTYKTHRLADDSADADETIAVQEALGRELLAALGLAVVGAEGFEAEDVIATLAADTPGRVEIVSGDRDLFALVEDPRVAVLYPLRGVSNLLLVDEAEIGKRYGIPGRRYLDFALLRGDPSDGLPGVKGIGEKTAAKLIAEHGSLDAVLAAIGSLPPAVAKKLEAGRDYLAAARRVVPPVANIPLGAVELQVPRVPRDAETVLRLAREHRLEAAVRRLADAMGAEHGLGDETTSV